MASTNKELESLESFKKWIHDMSKGKARECSEDPSSYSMCGCGLPKSEYSPFCDNEEKHKKRLHSNIILHDSFYANPYNGPKMFDLHYYDFECIECMYNRLKLLAETGILTLEFCKVTCKYNYVSHGRWHYDVYGKYKCYLITFNHKESEEDKEDEDQFHE